MREVIKEQVIKVSVPVKILFTDKASLERVDEVFETVVLPLSRSDIAQIEETARSGFVSYEELLLCLVKWELMDDLLNICEGNSDVQVSMTVEGPLRIE